MSDMRLAVQSISSDERWACVDYQRAHPDATFQEALAAVRAQAEEVAEQDSEGTDAL